MNQRDDLRDRDPPRGIQPWFGDTAARRLVLQRRYIEDIGSVLVLAAMQHACDRAEEIVRFRIH